MTLRDSLRSGRKAKLEQRESFKTKWRGKVQQALESMPDVDLSNAKERASDVARAAGIQDNEVGNPMMIAALVLQIILEVLKARNKE